MTIAPRRAVALACALAAGGLAPARAADNADDGSPTDGAETPVARSVRDGSYLPLTLSPTVGAAAALAAGYGGYDGARGVAVMVSYAEVRVWGPFALRGGAELGDTVHRVRPAIGGRLQLLSQARHGIDGAVSVMYRAEGFNEPEGEIEAIVSAGRRFGRATVLGNVACGQDPEARERDGEVRGALLVGVGQRMQVGIDGRWRFDLGSDTPKLTASREPTTDLDAGPVAALVLGPVALTAHAGVSVVRRVGDSTRGGGIALGGAGASF